MRSGTASWPTPKILRQHPAAHATHIEKLIRQVAEMKLNLRMIRPDTG
jgi:hypothetical protein